ncbi:MAG: site-2 protease family protein [Candidatus Nitrosotenuis sp.]|nr:MAG: site-2 protease family protein [Candidatus Nitrosotenuis sp.]
MTSPETPSQDAISIVSSIFTVRGMRQNLDALQFEIDGDRFKEKFVTLIQRLEPLNLAARLERVDGRLFVLVARFQPPRPSRVWIPRILFAVTIVMVMIDGYFRTVYANKIIPIGDPLQIAVLYTASLIGILGIHELGHLIALKKHKIRATWPYFIPGIPVLGIPTFGALIMQRGFMKNRDILFDVGFAGPIAGLIIAIIVTVYGAYVSPIVPISEAQALFSKSDFVQVHPSILMNGIITLTGRTTEGMEMLMSPVLYAAWLGFLITFLNLLPAWQLDGGHIARATLGRKWHKITTYIGIAVLFGLGYWFMALFILSFSMRNFDVRPLDDISPLSKRRKMVFVIAMALAVLTAPHPFSSMH